MLYRAADGDAADGMAAAIALHQGALEGSPSRHNLILGLLASHATTPMSALHFWSFDQPGSCALCIGTHNIVLGDLAPADNTALAASAHPLPFRGVVGPDDTALSVVDAFGRHGVKFGRGVAQGIHALEASPQHPVSPGVARHVKAEDAEVFGDFRTRFITEVMPHDPVLTPEQLAKLAASGRYMFWTVDGEAVAMAGKVRETATSASVGGVYTVPEHRNRGYAGSVTAALCDQLIAHGKRSISLYTDLSNPYSNRCYAKIGFKQICRSNLFLRAVT
jgi:ribosomal protein S18 acetylase RimI-like enzyme